MYDIENFDPSNLMQGVKDRVKATFVSLIPDDQWDKMCKSEIDYFFSTKENDYSNREKPSDFRLICSEVLKEMAKIKIIEFISSYESNIWNDRESDYNISDQLQDLIVKAAPEIFTNMFGNMFQKAVNNIRNY